MKNLKKYFAAVLISGIAFTSCDDPEQLEAEKEFDEFKTYVSTNSERFENEEDWEWDEYESEWNEYDRGYLEHATTIEDKRSYLSDENKKELDRIQTDYDRMRTRYETRATEEANATKEREVSTKMYASASIADPNNLAMDDVTETNYMKRYHGFVSYVDQNRHNFKQVDWENADRINEAYKKRRSVLGNKIAKQDNTEVKKLETKYTEMRSATADNTNTGVNTTNNTNTTATNTTKK